MDVRHPLTERRLRGGFGGKGRKAEVAEIQRLDLAPLGTPLARMANEGYVSEVLDQQSGVRPEADPLLAHASVEVHFDGGAKRSTGDGPVQDLGVSGLTAKQRGDRRRKGDLQVHGMVHDVGVTSRTDVSVQQLHVAPLTRPISGAHASWHSPARIEVFALITRPQKKEATSSRKTIVGDRVRMSGSGGGFDQEERGGGSMCTRTPWIAARLHHPLMPPRLLPIWNSVERPFLRVAFTRCR